MLPAAYAAVARITGRRFHLVTDRLHDRLPPRMQKTVDAAGHYLAPHYNWLLRRDGHESIGTAVLVERSGRRGIVLTNAHVVKDEEGVFFTTSRVIGGKVAFRLGGS